MGEQGVPLEYRAEMMQQVGAFAREQMGNTAVVLQQSWGSD